MPQLDALFIGAVNYDIYVRHIDNFVEVSSPLDEMKRRIGGGASITARALAALGMQSGVAGSVGWDSKIIVDELEKNGVLHFLKHNPDVETAFTVNLHYSDGRKQYKPNTEANKLFTPEDLQELYPHIKDSRLVMRTGYPWMPQIAGKPTAEMFDYARQHGVTTAFDMSNPNSWKKGMLEELISDVIPNVDLLCANERELYRLAKNRNGPELDNSELEGHMTPERSLEYAHRLLQRGVVTVNLHYGPRGTMLISNGSNIYEKAPEVNWPFNPTGTGNLQNAGVIYCMLNGSDLVYTAKFANTAATLRLSGTDFPTLQEVKAQLSK